MMTGYEVVSVIEMPDDNKRIRVGPVFDTRRDAEWFAEAYNAYGVRAWIEPVDWR